MAVYCLGLFVFLAVLSLVAAEALPPNSIPAMCVAICGPIVELSSMCSPKRSLGGFESDLNGEAQHPKRAERLDGRRIEKHLTVIIAAPTSFPSGLLGLLHSLFPPEPSALSLPPAPWPHSSLSSSPILPPATPASTPPLPNNYLTMRPSVQPLPTTSSNLLSTDTTVPYPAPTPTITSNAWPTTSTASVKKGMKTPDLATVSTAAASQHNSMMPTVLGLDGDAGGETSGWGMTENAEEQCVCSNESFNVAEITGLCASCVNMIANSQNDVEVIMSVCGFPPQQYSPEKDSLASSIHVQATRPAANTGGAKLNGASRSIWGANVGLAAGAAGFVIVYIR
ncbi:hypothetical protein TRIATDRAFT_318430 [Trichoderma atroviride IMI 206040]|uniref:Hydrophobin n=1 Tax=Hypocrea atroviridis (strain ATCC 20476 / IMI 206040) TaxID=452589 RepID=G9NV33_HYPAI|nr:uncharacterized protein TRIATDRAFT_318430 [Trichoderma atroviride IMI 206040]EHK44856.1 hypothetical protein TRIATDRAFT_318430 [Trichoderma atroviride IMI 206040]